MTTTDNFKVHHCITAVWCCKLALHSRDRFLHQYGTIDCYYKYCNKKSDLSIVVEVLSEHFTKLRTDKRSSVFVQCTGKWS